MIEANKLHQSIEHVKIRGSSLQNFFANILIAAPPSGQKYSRWVFCS